MVDSGTFQWWIEQASDRHRTKPGKSDESATRLAVTAHNPTVTRKTLLFLYAMFQSTTQRGSCRSVFPRASFATNMCQVEESVYSKDCGNYEERPCCRVIWPPPHVHPFSRASSMNQVNFPKSHRVTPWLALVTHLIPTLVGLLESVVVPIHSELWCAWLTCRSH